MLARFVNSLPNGLSQRITRLYFQVITLKQRQSHSSPDQTIFNTMEVKILPALQDNYMYLIVDKATKEAAIVDPVEPETVMKAMAGEGIKLTSVLTTHHHWDHAGGNEKIAKDVPEIEIYGADDRIGGLTKRVEHNTILNIGHLMVQCLFTPCHTSGHMCYYVTAPEEGSDAAVFTGDTLFLAGCGRFFEGSPEQMFNAISILSSLPDNTKVFCGHEYTLQNLKFAKHVEPRNVEVIRKMVWSQKRREQGKPTVPSTIGDEKKYNPFMRIFEPTVMSHANSQDAIETLKTIRMEKDVFN